MTSRTLYFFGFIMLPLLFLGAELGALLSIVWTDSRYTHIPIVPFIALGLIYLRRKQIFTDPKYDPGAGLAMTALAVGLCFVATTQYFEHEYQLTAVSTAVVASWLAGFVALYGLRTAQKALFPLSLLLLAIPIPATIVEIAEVALQRGSAEVAHVIFSVTSTPVFREGLLFQLPGLTIEVARECSGIRSTIALLITALVLSHLFLHSGWRKAWCVGLAIPIAIFKNAVRITTLSWLGAYVSQDYLHGSLHRRGGPLFSLLSLALLLMVLWALRRGEHGDEQKQGGARGGVPHGSQAHESGSPRPSVIEGQSP